MHVCISGFLQESSEDDSLKFDLKLAPSLNEQIAQLLGHRSLNAMAEGEWLLTNEQAIQISSLIGQPLPIHLSLFIGLEA
jgi:hypothetical protein